MNSPFFSIIIPVYNGLSHEMMLSTKRTEQEKLKIFVSAYACEPDLGSEIGVGWHWVLEMSKYFDLWVLTRESNRHTIEPWIDKHPAHKSYEKQSY